MASILSRYTLVFLLVTAGSSLRGQYSANDTALNIPMFYASYGFAVPGGDLADRFGASSLVGGGFQFKTRTNWLLGANFDFIFGSRVKDADSLMHNLKTESGYIIDMAGNFADYSVFERGFTVTARAGKVIPVLSPNPNSGFYIGAGIGYLQHKIRIEVANNSAPQLQGDYKKGYDRLTGGFMVTEFIGYLFLSDNRLLNFYGGFEFTQAFTSPRRDVYFDTMEPDPLTSRTDLLSGFRVGWIIPIFQRMPEKVYYY
jgi:hypothetical protein